MIIAVDGPSAAGKGTIARAIARELGYHFLDTGSLYRTVGFTMLRDGRDAADEKHAVMIARALHPDRVRDDDLRSENVAAMTSRIAQIPEVRQALLLLQREVARRKPGAVLDGRDIGTVVCPDADVKLFVTASSDIRARRRYEELISRGDAPDFDRVKADVAARDLRDSVRTLKAADAIVLDTSELSVEEGIAAALAAVRRAEIAT